MRKNMDDFERTLVESLKDPEIREEFEALEPEYTIRQQLLEARISLGLTQAELAERIGTQQSSIARIENGKCSPSLRFMQKLAKGMGKKLIITFQ